MAVSQVGGEVPSTQCACLDSLYQTALGKQDIALSDHVLLAWSSHWQCADAVQRELAAFICGLS
jgi:hypothetical protein